MKSFKDWAPIERGTTVGGVFMSRRNGHWLRGYLRALSEGKAGKDALLAGGRYGGMGGSTALGDLVVVKRMEAFLSQPDIQQALRNVYAECDFQLPDAVALHVQHIRGYTVEQQQVTKDGEVVTYQETIPPNYQALKDYLMRVTPKEPHRVNVLTARVGITRENRTDGTAPPMAARAIGETHDA